MREMRSELEVERERLEAQRRRDLEKLKTESEEELKAERKRLEEERKEEQLASLRLEVKERARVCPSLCLSLLSVHTVLKEKICCTTAHFK